MHIYCTRITFHSISRTIFLLPYFAGNPTQYPIDSVPTSRGFFPPSHFQYPRSCEANNIALHKFYCDVINLIFSYYCFRFFATMKPPINRAWHSRKCMRRLRERLALRRNTVNSSNENVLNLNSKVLEDIVPNLPYLFWYDFIKMGAESRIAVAFAVGFAVLFVPAYCQGNFFRFASFRNVFASADLKS